MARIGLGFLQFRKRDRYQRQSGDAVNLFGHGVPDHYFRHAHREFGNTERPCRVRRTSVRQCSRADFPRSGGSDLPAPTTSALGGVESVTCTNGQFINQISTAGVPQCTTPSGVGSSGLGNATTVIDVTQEAGTDFSTKLNACLAALPATGGTCDARGFSSPQTMSANITTTNPAAEIILPRGTIYRAVGAQFILVSGERIHGSLMQQEGTVIASDPSDTSAAMYSSTLIGGFEASDFQIAVFNPSAFGFDAPLTQSYVHDIMVGGQGSGFRLAGSGCSCYNMFENIEAVAIYLGNFANWNDWYHIMAGNQYSTVPALDIHGATYLNTFYGLSIEDALQSILFEGASHDNTIYNLNLENDGVGGSGTNSFLPVFAVGSLRNAIYSAVDVVDNSGNNTNIYGTGGSRPMQTQFTGKFVVSQIPDSVYGPAVSAHQSYYGNASSVTVRPVHGFRAETTALRCGCIPLWFIRLWVIKF